MMSSTSPLITRLRHDTKRRVLSVSRVEQLSAKMVRVVVQGDELEGFVSAGFDDHIKLLFPAGTGLEPSALSVRDYTPRRFDAESGELWIDFFLHDAGPATTWAAQAAVGQAVEIGGPRGSFVISPQGIDHHVLIGDETALPAINRRLDELPAYTRALVIAEVDDAAEWPAFASAATIETRWIERGSYGAQTPADGLIAKLRTLELPSERSFFWVALESQSARAVRRYLKEERAIDKAWVKAAAYWKRGVSGAKDKLDDE